MLKGLVVGGALLASGAVYSSRREPSSGVVSSLATVDDGASVASEIETVFEILKADYISAKIGQIECGDMTYALCALASCAAITDKTSACGCKYETKTVGKFSVDISSSVLIKSPTFRDVVMLLYKDATEAGKEKLCSGLSDGTIYREAGYLDATPSFYDPAAAEAPESSAAAAATTEAADSYNQASCMGAPCKAEFAWGGGCSVTCACPFSVETATDAAAVGEAEGSGGHAAARRRLSDTCFKNGMAVTEVTWEYSLTELLDYVDDLTTVFAGMTADVIELASDTCDATCL